MAEPQAVGGISVPLSIDRSRWSAELKAARQEYDQFRSHISRSGGMAPAGVGRVAAGVVGPAAGVTAPPGPPMATVGNVSPRFSVSAGSVRDMRIEINKQLRTFAGQGEAVQIPIRLGRVNFGQMRTEISAGIGVVPVKVALDPGSIPALRAQITRAATGSTGSGGRATTTRRAAGGPVFMQGGGRARTPIRQVVESGYTLSPAELRPHIQAYRHISDLAAARNLSAWGGNIWYPGRRRAALEQALAAGHLTTGQGIGPMVRSARTALALPGIASPGMPDKIVGNWVAEIMAVAARQGRGAAGGVDPRQLVIDIQRRTRLAPGRGYSNLTKAMEVALGQKRWQDVLSPSSPKVTPFTRTVMGARDLLVADSHHLQAGMFTGTMGDAASRVGKPTGAYPAGRPTRERAIMLAASKHVHGEYRDVWPRISQWQAGIWGEHFPLGTGGGMKQPIENAYTNIIVPKGAQRTIPEGWTMGPQGLLIPRRSMQAGGRIGRGYCSVCRSNVADPVTHRSTAKHLRSVRGPARGTGDWLRPRQSWMNALRQPGGDEELYEERATSYPPMWRPGMQKGGPVFRQVPAEVFHATISEASNVVRGSGRRVGETVSTYPLEEYAQMRTYLNRTRTAGYAIKPDGDLVSVFNVGAKGAGKAAIRSAIQRGATKLDAFDEVGTVGAISHPVHPHDVQKNLPRFYSQFGFREVGRDPWDPQYAPEGWTGGTPDVVYMRRKLAAGGRGFAMRGTRPLDREALLSTPYLTRDKWQSSPWAPPVTTGGKYIQIDPRWLPQMSPKDFPRNQEGGPIKRSLAYGDPNGLHMRPASALAKAAQMAELTGHKVRVANESLGQALSYPGSGSILGWMQLGANKGNRLRIEVSGPQAERFAGIFEQLIGFAGPEATGMSYTDFHRSVGALTPAVESIDIRMSQRRPHRAAGGDVSGQYIVNEIGREKFVPDRLSHMIPPDVFDQLPKRQEGGITEIEGHGARLWEAPEDGWIIPARLANKVPGRHPGGPVGHHHPHRNAPGTGFQDEQGRSVPDPRETVRGIFRRQNYERPPITPGPPPAPETWRGAMFGTGGGGTGARDFAASVGNAFRGALQSVFGRQPVAGPIRGPGGPRDFSAGQPFFDPYPSGAPPPEPPPAAGAAGGRRRGAGLVGARPRTAAPTRRGGGTNLVSARVFEETYQARRGLGALQGSIEAETASFLNLLPRGGGGGGLKPADIARQSLAAVRGLTGASSVGGLFGATLGGGAARRRAFAEGQALAREAQALAPRGARFKGMTANEAWDLAITEFGDTIDRHQKKIDKLDATYKKQTERVDEHGKVIGATADETAAYTAKLTDLQGKLGKANQAMKSGVEAQIASNELQLQSNRKFAAASGGALRNIASMTAAGFAFSALSTAISTGLELATTAAKPFVDEITGFGSVATRITQGLAQQTRQAGGYVTGVVAGAAGAAGVGPEGLTYLTNVLAPSISAKAGAMAAQEASDLFRAAAGVNNAPTGLFGGYGGLGGGSFLAEFMGGGKGMTEILAGDVASLRGQALGLTGINALRGTGNIGHDPIGDFLFGTGGTSRGLTGDIGAAISEATGFGRGPGGQPAVDQAAEDMRQAVEVMGLEADDYTAAAERGARALGEHTTGLRLATKEQLNLTEGSKELARAQERMTAVGGAAGDPNAARMAQNGVFLVDKNNQPVDIAADYRKFFEQAATGRTIMPEEAFRAQEQRGILAQRAVGVVETEEAMRRQIPFELGMRLAAQPYVEQVGPRGALTGFRGTAREERQMRSQLGPTMQRQQDLMEIGQQGIKEQTEFVTKWAGATKGVEFGGLMDEIEGLGQKIGQITAQLADQTAAASFHSYANNLRLINRSLADARGLAGQAGGSAFGAMQRQQFMLSRESQRLSLQSTRIGLESNALQLELAQRQINYQRAVAGFSAPGVTPEETQANVKAADIEADFAQRMLDLQKQQQGIGQQQYGISSQQFGLELKIFMEAARRGVTDLEAQRDILKEQRALEVAQIRAQKRIAALVDTMGDRQARAQQLIHEAQQNYNTELNTSARYVANYGNATLNATDALRDMTRFIRTWIKSGGVSGTTNPRPEGSPSGPQQAAGVSMFVDQPTSFIAGEAGSEHVLVIRNPRSGVMGAAGGGGGGGGGTVIIDVHDNNVASKEDETKLMNLIVAAVEKAQARKLTLIGGRAS